MPLKINHRLFIAIFFFTVATILITYPLVFNMHTHIYGPFFGTDIRGTLWFSWWYKFAYAHKIDMFRCPFLAAPFGLDFSNMPFFWISLTLTKFLTIITNPVFALNLLSLTSLIACGIITFILAYRLTASMPASLAAGFIFAFSPYHLNKLMEFSYVYIGTFFVLYVYSLLRLKDVLSKKNILLASAAFGLLLDFSPYYAYFAGLFTAFFFIFCFSYQWKDKAILVKKMETAILRRRIGEGGRLLRITGIVFVMALFVNAPALFKILKNLLALIPSGDSAPPQATFGHVRSFEYLITQAARPLSYLLPASSHPFFGDFTKRMFGSVFYGRGPIEQTLYLGWIPILLAVAAFTDWKHKRLNTSGSGYVKTKENFFIGFFIFSSLAMLLCSLPPFLDVGFFKIYFPSFFLHKIFPMFRAYARCGMVVMFCVSILAGYGIKFLLEKCADFSKRSLFMLLVFCGIAFEFTNIPPLRAAEITKIPPAYVWLKEQPGDFIIAEYPMSAAVAGEASENYDYLFYQTFHEKRMVNGSMPGTEAYRIKEKILKIENRQTPDILKSLGVKYIILHLDLYRSGEYKEAAEYTGAPPDMNRLKAYRLVRAFGTDAVYALADSSRSDSGALTVSDKK